MRSRLHWRCTYTELLKSFFSRRVLNYHHHLKMSSKVISQQRITDTFSQQKSGIAKSKDKGKLTPGRPIKSSVNNAVKVESADDLIRRKHLDTLRQFDLDWKFGPCTGITRLERWERAERHGHHPPQDVKDLVLEHEDDQEYVQNIWTGYAL